MYNTNYPISVLLPKAVRASEGGISVVQNGSQFSHQSLGPGKPMYTFSATSRWFLLPKVGGATFWWLLRALILHTTVWLDGARPANTCILPTFPWIMPTRPHGIPTPVESRKSGTFGGKCIRWFTLTLNLCQFVEHLGRRRSSNCGTWRITPTFSTTQNGETWQTPSSTSFNKVAHSSTNGPKFEPSGDRTVVDESTHNPEFKGSNPAAAGTQGRK